MSNKQNDEINEALYEKAEQLAHEQHKDPSEYIIGVIYSDLLNKI